MRDNHDISVCGSKSFRKEEEEDRLSIVEGKKMHDLNGSRGGTDPFVFDANAEDEHPKAKVLDDFKESELEMQRSSEVAVRESRKSGSVRITISELYETDEDLYTDKNILECEPPEFSNCSNEAHSQVVKDICIDEGMPENKKNSSAGSNGDGAEASLGSSSNIEGRGPSDKTKAGDEKLLSECRQNTASENSFDDDPMKIGEANPGAESDVVDREPLVQDHGLPGNDVSESQTSSSLVETEPKDDNQQDSVSYNSKVESGSITFDFSYTPQEPPSITDEKTNKSNGKSDESGKSNDDANENRPDTSPITCTADVCGQDRDIKDDNPDKTSGSSEIRAESLKNGDDPAAAEMKDMKSDDASSFVGPHRHDEGETSFSAASLVSYSGPVAYSGSLSMRSEGSATSGRSFAFPVLQSEWNTSPVRMAKADRRAFRKHKGWRSGLLCCRF